MEKAGYVKRERIKKIKAKTLNLREGNFCLVVETASNPKKKIKYLKNNLKEQKMY